MRRVCAWGFAVLTKGVGYTGIPHVFVTLWQQFTRKAILPKWGSGRTRRNAHIGYAGRCGTVEIPTESFPSSFYLQCWHSRQRRFVSKIEGYERKDLASVTTQKLGYNCRCWKIPYGGIFTKHDCLELCMVSSRLDGDARGWRLSWYSHYRVKLKISSCSHPCRKRRALPNARSKANWLVVCRHSFGIEADIVGLSNVDKHATGKDTWDDEWERCAKLI